ncbi:FAD-dependent oxidoreductase [Candidatus Poribacteria bacterium]|nr:FAD-dependent oxidoreductase [Candidatus Poribacteria bacterium]MBT5536920.1 FAD-dependent oxidoreductase [Candidatus Poribacteria bacterium]MBT5711461.1 FAD-dependent oxidoreductase [Candidatus Poribacteria bacterium]MBT7807240.1 FAD-dependent oxidoreductase [Candidatus Poribacteria bacterium]
MTRTAEAVIVGGGIWGLSAAYHLADMGISDVCVLERNPIVADETTSQAAGLVGQIRSSALMVRAIQYSLELLTRFQDDMGRDMGLRRNGSLFVALTPERQAAYERKAASVRDEGITTEFPSAADMRAMAPDMDTSEIVGGLYVNGDGYLDPRKCAQAYGAAAEELGVTIETGATVTGFRFEGRKLTGVETMTGVVSTDTAIITAGPWGGMLAAHARHTAAMRPLRHQRAETVPVDTATDHMPVVRVTDVSCYVRPWEGGYTYGFFEPEPVDAEIEAKPPDYATSDIEPPVAVMAEARRRLAPVFPTLEYLGVAQYRRGMTSFAPDGGYIVGPVPGIEGLYMATACAALGIAGSAAVGRWLANWVVDGDPGDDLSAFSPDRFGDRVADGEWLRAASSEYYGSYYAIRD